MEELSPIYDNVSIRDWADNIRQMKIRELEEYIKNVRKMFGIDEPNMHPLVYFNDKMRIVELERKLEALKNAK